jgi:hypothetical protein
VRNEGCGSGEADIKFEKTKKQEKQKMKTLEGGEHELDETKRKT